VGPSSLATDIVHLFSNHRLKPKDDGATGSGLESPGGGDFTQIPGSPGLSSGTVLHSRQNDPACGGMGLYLRTCWDADVFRVDKHTANIKKLAEKPKKARSPRKTRQSAI
jgi:hypothetical protein